MAIQSSTFVRSSDCQHFPRAVTRRARDEGLIPSEMAVRVIGSWYYTSELPADEAATLRAAMVSKDCESLETWSLCGRSAPATHQGRAGPAVWAKNCSSEACLLPICRKNCSERSCRSGLRSGTNVIHTINKLGRCFLLERLPLREQQLPRALESRLRRPGSKRPHDVVRRGDATRRSQRAPRGEG